ncbi:glycosyltransferase family 4 protein [Chitiniphilus purpureus]|uniref:Glycosyltransferase family 4 protein n=1 Tax=Chitiniphilus purpureus TaxID=2981137 RepID=A0ABY6DKR9_9NEIS|nr:glycosyltransferase family 4 protein [Chitiniphilus sp. CD1]UXY14627.1 glycosyltransferase family 4 protein [Chitiniphilus sp. CD1]
MKRQVVMVGPSPLAHGGMAFWAKSASEAGLLTELDVRYISSYVDASRPRKFLVALGAWLQLLMLLLCRRVSLLHVHVATRASLWRKLGFIELARLFARPYVVHLHGGMFPNYYERNRERLIGRLLVRMLRGADAVIVLSPEWREWVAQLAPAVRVLVIPNAVIWPEQVETLHDPLSLLYLGRIEAAKGIEELLVAVRRLRDEGVPLRLTVAGDGQMSWFWSKVQEHGVTDALEYVGWVSGERKEALLRTCGVFVLPSHLEALPFGVLEAMAYGRVIVATRVGGIPFALGEGSAGLLIEPQSVEALCQALMQLAKQHPAANLSLASDARERARQFFSFPAIRSQLEELYDVVKQ